MTSNLSQESSFSSLSHNNYRQRRKKKDNVNEYIETVEKRLTNNASKKQIHHNKPKVTIPQNKDQSVAELTNDKSPAMIKQQNNLNKKTITSKDPELKRLKILTEIYNPKNKQ